MTRTRSLRVKVAVSDLIRKVEASKAKAVSDYEKAVEKFKADSERYAGKVSDALHKAHLASAKGQAPIHKSDHWGGRSYGPALVIPVNFARPSKPSKPNTQRQDRHLGILRLATDDFITIGTDDDFASYL